VRWLLLTLCICAWGAGQNAPPQQRDIPIFGTTVVDMVGLRGEIYLLPPATEFLPGFRHLKSVGLIYTTKLNIPTRDFRQGFPGLRGPLEWFAIDYKGRFWMETAGRYLFALSSDDGSKLYIDGKGMIDNDGVHSTASCIAKVELARGLHTIRVSYFQGPGWQVALVLALQKEGEPWKIFDTRNFAPPADSEAWSQEVLPTKKARKVSGGDCWAP
jgi:hypothetical protein